MAIVENKASEIGDVILIRAEVPIVGLVTLASFTDSILNETGAKFFTKEFRYSTDGINYSSWTTLTNTNIAAVPVTPTSTFLIEYRYTRTGSDPSLPDLQFNQVQVTGNFTDIPCGDAYSNSIFGQFFTCTDTCVLSWMINVLEKMYKQGVLPNYIERDHQHNESGQDNDFLEFWKTITQYFAYIVCYARQWELSKATGNYEILIDYLRNQTFIFCGDEPIEDLIYIMNNTYDEMRHRGTYEIIKTKLDDSRPVDGEWHRLFCNLGKCTDWYFSNVFNYKIGWVGDQASPLYKGNYFDWNLTKAYEDTENVTDLNNYPRISSSYISTGADIANDGSSIQTMSIIGVPAGAQSGVGHTSSQPTIGELIPVSYKCDYEITFWVKMEDQDNLFTVGVNTYDENGNLLGTPGTSSAFWNTPTNTFFEKVQVVRGNKYSFVRVIIYAHDHKKEENENFNDYLPSIITEIVPSWVLNINYSTSPHLRSYLNSNHNNLGNKGHLKFNTQVCFISPTILLDNESEIDISGTLRLYDIKVRLLRTHYATGFEQVSGFIKMGVENFNLNHTSAQAEEIIREFLIPYNSTFKMSFINPCETTNINDVRDILLQTDARWTSPLYEGVVQGDRYLVWNGTTLELFECSSSSSWVSVDNVQGNKVYIVEKRSVFAYDNSKWNFSCK